MTLYLGLDVGGTTCAAVVGDADGNVRDRVGWPAGAERGPDAMIDDLCHHGRALIDRHGAVASVGGAIGGPFEAGRGIIDSPPNLPGWDGIPLKAQLAEVLGVPVHVEHDAAIGYEHLKEPHGPRFPALAMKPVVPMTERMQPEPIFCEVMGNRDIARVETVERPKQEAGKKVSFFSFHEQDLSLPHQPAPFTEANAGGTLG